MRNLYDLKGKRESFWFLIHRLFGQATFRPWVMVQQGKINTEYSDPESLIVNVGGPGSVVVRKDTAVVLEQNGRLTRVEGPGLSKLEPFERIYDTLDLRPQRRQFPVFGLTKEGIPVVCETDVHFQIQNGGQLASEEMPFPLDTQAVWRASTSKWIREAHRLERDRILDWKGLIILSATEGTLRFILARYPLDRLIAPEAPDLPHPLGVICKELESALHKAAARVGARILKVKLGRIKVADAVTQKWIDGWRADWERWGTVYLATAESEYARTIATIKNEILAKRIITTTNLLHQQASESAEALVKIAKMQLHLALRNIGSDSLALTYLPAEATKQLESAAGSPLASEAQDKESKEAPTPPAQSLP
jgi:hypothetical protein